jgi:hypothetical protein
MENALLTSAAAPVDRDNLPLVRGEIAFARRSPDENAPSYVFPNIDLPSVLYDIPIRNARSIARELSLDKEGFVLVRQPTSCRGVSDPEAVKQRFIDETMPFIKNYFNASWVVASPTGCYMRRSQGTVRPKEWTRSMTVRQPGGNAHYDYAAVAGPMLAAAANQDLNIPIRPYSRLMIIQAWRALSPPPQDIPLAFCDARTLAAADAVEYEYMSNFEGKAGSSFRTVNTCYDPAQHWYYFPDLTADELILFKGYDSESHYAPRASHSAFDNRRATPNAHPRESIEGRFFEYYA